MHWVKMKVRIARLTLVCLLMGVCPTVGMAEELQFPFPAEVVEDAVLVRAGVGTTYYVVKKLKKGDLVTVDEKLFHWYKIVPPAGVHSYVSKAFVDAKGDGKVGVVNKTPCEVFTASVNGVADSFRRTTNLLKGDTVEIVAEDGGYYKIMPPKGTYVYIPAVSVKEAQFKPAQTQTPVAVETSKAVSTPSVVAVEVAKPAIVVTPKPVVAVSVKPEPITMPDPESLVMTAPKPVETAVEVTTPEPKPVVMPVVTPEPVASVEPVVASTPTKPVSTPVPLDSDAPRLLVISKPQPGDSLPVIPDPVNVVEMSVEPKSVVSVIPSSHDRIIPPIPDTETPPNFEGLPKYSVEPSTNTTVLNTTMPDTNLPAATHELVVDKPATVDRLGGAAPSKPALPVMAQSTELKPTPVIPNFPSIPQAPQPLATQTELPTVTPTPAPVSVVVPTSAPKPTPTPASALAPKPKVNPLLASRVHFQAQTTSLSDLEQRMVDAHQLPLDQRPLDELLAAYLSLSDGKQLPIGDQRIIQARVAQLKRDINLSNALKSIGAVKTSNSYVIPSQPAIPAESATPSIKQYDRVGQLLASALYDGKNLPRLYRLVNPANPNVTLIYVRPNANVNAATHLGQMVGIVGVPQVDDALNLKLIAPQEVGLYKAQ